MTQHRSIKCLRPLLFITTTSTGDVSTLSLKQGVNHCKSKTRLWSLFPRGHSQAVPHLDKHTLNVNTQSVVQMIQTELFRSCVTNRIPMWVFRSHRTDVPHDYCPVHNTRIHHWNAYRWIELNWNWTEELNGKMIIIDLLCLVYVMHNLLSHCCVLWRTRGLIIAILQYFQKPIKGLSWFPSLKPRFPTGKM